MVYNGRIGRRVGGLLLLPLLALGLLLGFGAAPSAHAQDDVRCFPETGNCMSGVIRAYWEANGGLAVFGYPISELSTETIDGWTGPVQWFERDRLEDHTAQGEGVLAGRLGATLLDMQGRSWFTFPSAETTPSNCTYFETTDHTLCEPFRSYWLRNGGLERFGYPITEPFEETIGDWTGTVQYFERRRMEYHPENRGTPFTVLLGLLGNEVRNFDPLASCRQDVLPQFGAAYDDSDVDNFRADLGCPLDERAYSRVMGAVQNFENGLMIWVGLGEQRTDEDSQIYAIISPGFGATHFVYRDTWQTGDPDTPNVNPPDGLHKPRRGFGKVWIEDPTMRNRIGWAIEEIERPVEVTVQFFDNGSMLRVNGTGVTYVLGPNDWQAAVITE